MATRREHERPRREPGPINRLLHWPVMLIVSLIVAFVWSVVIELVLHGQGAAAHSTSVLETEVGYLHRDFSYAVGWLSSPFTFVSQALEWTRREVVGTLGLNGSLGTFMATVRNVLLIIAVRISLVVFTLPTTFAFMGTWGLVQGMKIRELRKAGGAQEGGAVFHIAKFINKPIVLLPVMLYLALPFAIHPSLVFLPFAALFTAAVAIMASRFMKFFLE